MIVISRNLVVSPTEAALPPGTPWIGWQNIVTATNVSSVTSADAQHPISLVANPFTHLQWISGVNTGDEYITIGPLTLTDPIDYVGVARHNFGTTRSIISIEGIPDPGASPQWVELVQGQILPNDSPVIFRFTPQILTGVRLRIQPGASNVHRAAVVYVGKLLLMERGVKIDVDHVPLPYGRKAKIATGFSESGNYMGRIVTQESRESKANFAHITPTWYRAKLDPFIAASKQQPFFWAWNPSEYPLETGYCWMVNEPVPATSPVTRRVSIDLEMRGVI